MVAHDSKLERLPARGDRFATTHWSMVVSAGGSHSSEARRALAALCENYWFPLYAFVRRAGYSAEDAQDLHWLRSGLPEYVLDCDFAGIPEDALASFDSWLAWSETMPLPREAKIDKQTSQTLTRA
jgi:RNA polymerase sigma-70 factor (ECF subfamily)